VFALANGAVLLLRGDHVEHDHFSVPAVVPVLGIGACAALLTQQEAETWLRAGVLLAVGGVLWAVNHVWGRSRRAPT
jgi:hypothetical protein